MTTREIPRREWAMFFDAFSRAHKGWLATLEVFGDDLGAQTAVRSLPFAGIGADTKSRENRIAVTLGVSPDASITHGISAPRVVTVSRNQTGADDALEIQARDGTVTLVSFHTVGGLG